LNRTRALVPRVAILPARRKIAGDSLSSDRVGNGALTIAERVAILTFTFFFAIALGHLRRLTHFGRSVLDAHHRMCRHLADPVKSAEQGS
jgi:hypothetical protein